MYTTLLEKLPKTQKQWLLFFKKVESIVLEMDKKYAKASIKKLLKKVESEEVSYFRGKEIAEIGAWCFAGTEITSIFIPKTILCIYESAFGRCDYLTEVRFEKGSKLQSFGVYMFWCSTTLKKIDFPASVTSITTNSNNNFFRLCQS